MSETINLLGYYYTEDEIDELLNGKIDTSKEIPRGTENDPTSLNDYKETGFYYSNTNAEAQYITPLPQEGKAFFLMVENFGDTSTDKHTKQTLTHYDQDIVYIRRCNGSNNWTSWIALSIEGHTHNEKENISNKVSSWTGTTTNTTYPSEKLVKKTFDEHTHTNLVPRFALRSDTTYDLDDFIDPGFYSIPTVPSKSLGHRPFGDESNPTLSKLTYNKHAILEVRLYLNNNINNYLQIYTVMPSGSENIFYRSYTGSGGWGEWKQVAKMDEVMLGVEIIASDENIVNLDDYIYQAGAFYCKSNSSSQYVINTPRTNNNEIIPCENNKAFYLFVEKFGTSNTYVKQTFTFYNEDAIYIRTKRSSSSWSKWTKINNDYNNLINTPTIPEAYVHPSGIAKIGNPTNNPSPVFGGTFKITQFTSDNLGHIIGATDRTVKIPDALGDGTTAGLSLNNYTQSDKNKLDNIDEFANNYEHPNSGVTAGTNYNSNQTPSFNSTFNIPKLTFDGQGHITGSANSTVKIPALPNASTSTAGIVQLSNATDNTSTTLAATANAIKKTFDEFSNESKKTKNAHTHKNLEITKINATELAPQTLNDYVDDGIYRITSGVSQYLEGSYPYPGKAGMLQVIKYVRDDRVIVFQTCYVSVSNNLTEIYYRKGSGDIDSNQVYTLTWENQWHQVADKNEINSDNREFYSITRKHGDSQFLGSLVNKTLSSMYFTLFGRMVIVEYALRTSLLESESSEYIDNYHYFKIGSVPEKYSPLESTKYHDVSGFDGHARIAIKTNGDILLKGTIGQEVNVYGSFIYFIDTDTYLTNDTIIN